MKPKAYHRPSTFEEAWTLKAADGDARFIAGGTDLMVGDRLPRTVISLRGIPGLDGIVERDGSVRIGALTLISDLAAHETIVERYPVLIEACRCFGSMQIRNAATVGGNLCNASPAADLAPPLLVLGARVGMRGPEGAREIPLEEFFTGPGLTSLAPGEILTEVLVDEPAPAFFLRKSRVRMDIALVSVAVRLEVSEGRCSRVRIAAGSAAPMPLRLRDAEAVLEGQVATAKLATQAAKAAAAEVRPVDDIRTTAAYRRRLVEVYVRRAVERLLGER